MALTPEQSEVLEQLCINNSDPRKILWELVKVLMLQLNTIG